MKPYELTYIIASQEKAEDAENLKKDLEVFVQEKGGVILKSEKTAPQTLAYPIRKNSSGYFCTLEFQIEEGKIKEIKEKVQKDKRILRHFIIIKKPIKQMKERRTRRTMQVPEFDIKEPLDNINLKPGKEKTKAVKVELKDVEKKLDEILSE